MVTNKSCSIREPRRIRGRLQNSIVVAQAILEILLVSLVRVQGWTITDLRTKTLCPQHSVRSTIFKEAPRRRPTTLRLANENEDKSKDGGIIGGIFSRFASTSDGTEEEKEKTEDKATEDDDGKGPIGFIRGFFRSGSSEKETDDKPNVDLKKLKKQAEKEAAKREIEMQKEREGRKKQIEKKLSQRRKEQEKKKKKEEKENARAQKNNQSDDGDDSSLGSRIQSFFISNKDDSNNTSTKDEKRRGVSASTQRASTNPLSAVQRFWFDRTSGNSEGAQEEWVVVFPKTRIMPGETVPVTINGIDLLVIASRDGRKLYCIANACPHLGTPLETGQLVRLPVEDNPKSTATASILQEKDKSKITEQDISDLLSQDGCEDCIVCPTHRTAFALSSGEVRGEWCPYPPVLGKVMGQVKPPTNAATFDIRTRGKNVEVRINSLLEPPATPQEEEEKR